MAGRAENIDQTLSAFSKPSQPQPEDHELRLVFLLITNIRST